jgi:hypothetical protein
MTKMQLYQLSALLLACATSLLAAASPLNEIPSTGEEWMSLADGTEFQPSAIKGDATKQRALRDAQKRFLGEDNVSSTSSSSASDIASRTSNSELYVDSQNTYYDAYMQSWRYLGFYIDCSPARNLGRRHRRLESDETVGCQRYLLWAAVSATISIILISMRRNIPAHQLIYLSFLFICSTSIWTTRAVELESTSITIPRLANGTKMLAILMETDAARTWTATCPILTGPCWDSSKSQNTLNGLNSSLSIKVTVSGMTRTNSTSCTEITILGRRIAQRLEPTFPTDPHSTTNSSPLRMET